MCGHGSEWPQACPAIEAYDVEKRYGDRQVLCGVDLEVRVGEVFCLLGPNGAGKTTTVEILEGYREASRGTVRVLGMDPHGQPRALRERIGVVLQDCGFPARLRVSELVDAHRSYYSRPRARAELLDIVELRDERNSTVRNLSGGQRRRLDLGLALAGDPDLVFLDEPTTGFDPEARRRCWTAIENLRALGTTVLLTTHDLDEAERLADRVAILTDGRIAACGTTTELAHEVGALTRISFTVPSDVRTRCSVVGDMPAEPPDDGRAVISTPDPTAALRSLLDWTNRHGIACLDDLAVVPPTLEDVYLHFVDRSKAHP
jgi:ABC-2 type transport system ATP-binding protein